MTANYEWVITKDKIADPDAESGSFQNAIGLTGPRGATNSADFIQKNGEKFRMKDDDGEIYYYGYLMIHKEETGEEEFAPLYDFGMPNAGCTSIEYKDKNGNWAQL